VVTSVTGSRTESRVGASPIAADSLNVGKPRAERRWDGQRLASNQEHERQDEYSTKVSWPCDFEG